MVRQPDSSRIFPKRKAVRSIKDEKGVEVENQRVLVVVPYDREFNVSEKTCTLLINSTLKKEYEDLLKEASQAKDALLDAIKMHSGTKIDFENEISTTFMKSPKEFDGALHRIKKELENQTDTPFASVEYQTIFNEKVMAALNTKNLKSLISEFVKRYNELLDGSTYFKKGLFDYYNAGQIAKSLADNGFFKASHTVSLRAAQGNKEITNQKELEGVIDEEKEKILTDPKLRKVFEDVSGQLYKNVELRMFCRYLQANEPLLAQMANPEKFKEEVLKSFIKKQDALYQDWLAKDAQADEGRKKIEAEAKAQNSLWTAVIEIFNDRFVVPFTLTVKNQVEVALGKTSLMDLGYIYNDGAETADIPRSELIEALSNGERKALYILNVLFEVETRKTDKTETLIVVDDIADSFDYQNKYAIIEYLKELSEDSLFKMLIMTHNFDFFRTVESRFVDGANCLMASKNDTGTTLTKAAGVRNVFKNWKSQFFTNPKIKIACIPFVRNLIEMSVGSSDARYKALTALLHVKPNSAAITVADLDQIFQATCPGAGGPSPDPAKPIFDLLNDEATACLAPGGGMNLENKIVLAIAIRIAAEKFMIAKINDAPWVGAIRAFQTPELIRRFKKDFPNENEAVATLNQVSLMTPENIHLNSFMYEPIIDMSDDQLRKLYKRVLALK